MSTIEMNPPASGSAQEAIRDTGKSPLLPVTAIHREPPADKSLDMVRNILFGEQVRDMERKQSTLERFIRVSVNSAAEETQKKVDALNHEISLLKDLLATETKSRQDDILHARTRLEQHEKIMDELNKKGQLGRDELHARVGREVERLDQRLGDWRKDLLEQLRQTAEQLRHEKADRKAVAGILNGMARQLFDTEAGGED